MNQKEHKQNQRGHRQSRSRAKKGQQCVFMRKACDHACKKTDWSTTRANIEHKANTKEHTWSQTSDPLKIVMIDASKRA